MDVVFSWFVKTGQSFKQHIIYPWFDSPITYLLALVYTYNMPRSRIIQYLCLGITIADCINKRFLDQLEWAFIGVPCVIAIKLSMWG